MRLYEVGIVGGGFTGSLLAYVLASRGVRVVVIDSTPHPRFAIGESSTPVADLLLENIARRFALDPLLPLCRYGTWKRERLNLTCGKKRGFSYFQHHPDRAFQETEAHEHSLLVAASADDEQSDLHWMRSDVDHEFFRLAMASGAEAVLGTVADVQANGEHWTIQIQAAADSPPHAIACEFFVDASGGNRRLQSALGIQDASHRLLTDTRSTFGHFIDVHSWRDWLRSQSTPTLDHPFDCDASAQHHLLRHGWLWMLRMDDGRTSVGWTRPRQSSPSDDGHADAARDPLRSLGIDRYPPLREIMREARLVAPATGLRETGRIQRFASRIAGSNFALMPTAAATIDPLHSSGIAHGLSGVLRLSRILLESSSSVRTERLARYEQQVFQEVQLMDRLVAGCYLAIPWFEMFAAHAACYFVAAIRCEEAIAAGNQDGALWCADQPDLTSVVDESFQRIAHRTGGGRLSPSDVQQHVAWARDAIAPWNHVGLMDPSVANMYRYTTAPK